MMRFDKHILGAATITLSLTIAALLLSGCGKDSNANPNGTSNNTKNTPVKNVVKTEPKEFNIVYARDIAQAPRSSVRNNPHNWPPVEFEPANMNFGVVPPHTIGKGYARIWNVGNGPLLIKESRTSCGCTNAENLAGKIIQPGGYLDFMTEMEMKSGLATKKEKISILFEGYNTFIPFFYHAEVARSVRVVPPYIEALNERMQSIQTGTVQVVSLDNKPFNILKSHGEAPQFVGFDPATDEPRKQYTLKWDMNQFAGKTVPMFWAIETDHPSAPLVDVRVRHSTTRPDKNKARPWQPKDQRVLLDELRNGETSEVVVKHEHDRGVRPQPSTAKVICNSSNLDVVIAKTKIKGRFLEFTLHITPKNAKPGLLYEVIEIGSMGQLTKLRIIGLVAQ
ncbi:MAG: DUF1573 domain-containing protein [Planctomycetes bacterium]|nr:DUF1573 domain-containing protein [Planctomycetota bacterium]